MNHPMRCTDCYLDQTSTKTRILTTWKKVAIGRLTLWRNIPKWSIVVTCVVIRDMIDSEFFNFFLPIANESGGNYGVKQPKTSAGKDAQVCYNKKINLCHYNKKKLDSNIFWHFWHFRPGLFFLSQMTNYHVLLVCVQRKQTLLMSSTPLSDGILTSKHFNLH